MSKINVFQVNPIFYMPIDFDESKKVDNSKKDDTSSELDLSSSIEEDEEDEDSNILTFSLIKDNRNLQSKTNSSKIYISEIFKKNWKIKARRLMAKIKKRLIKQWKNANSKNILENNNCNNTNWINNIIIESNNINKNLDLNNYYIKKINSMNHENNNILANLFCNDNCQANNYSNIYTNINYNCNNYNNNNNNNLTYFNSLINNYNNNNINIGY